MNHEDQQEWELPVLVGSAFVPNFDNQDFKALAESEELGRLCKPLPSEDPPFGKF